MDYPKPFQLCKYPIPMKNSGLLKWCACKILVNLIFALLSGKWFKIQAATAHTHHLHEMSSLKCLLAILIYLEHIIYIKGRLYLLFLIFNTQLQGLGLKFHLQIVFSILFWHQMAQTKNRTSLDKFLLCYFGTLICFIEHIKKLPRPISAFLKKNFLKKLGLYNFSALKSSIID